MKKIILFALILLITLNSCFASRSYSISLSNIDDNLMYNEIIVTDANNFAQKSTNSKYTIELLDINENILYKNTFNPASYGPFTLNIPYINNAVNIKITGSQKNELFSLDISSYAYTCGNKICEYYENYEICSKDCNSGEKDNVCDEEKDNICDPDCKMPVFDIDCQTDEKIINEQKKELNSTKKDDNQSQIQKPFITEQPKKNSFKIILIFAFATLSVLILLILFLVTRNKKDDTFQKQLTTYFNQNLKKGYSIEQIRNNLLSQNYNQQIIDNIIKNLR